MLFQFVSCSNIDSLSKSQNTENNNNVYFVQWDSYQGYFLNEKTGYIELAFLDYTGDFENFCGDITNVELLPENDIIETQGFNFLEGSKSSKYVIRTLHADYKLKKSGIVNLKEIQLTHKDKKMEKWNIGNWDIDVKDDQNPGNIELGQRMIIFSSFENYVFGLKNVRKQDITIKDIVFKIDIGNGSKKFTVSDKMNPLSVVQKTLLNSYILKPGESKYFIYYLNSKTGFYCIKPFLNYLYNNQQLQYPLDVCVYSPVFTDDVIKNIKDSNMHIMVN